MPDWISNLDELASRQESSVLITVAGIRGSAPRETGAKMIVTTQQAIGSIGGGQLEHQCTAHAVAMLRSQDKPADKRRFSLGANCGQCCGGVVEVLFEHLPGSRAAWLEQVAERFDKREPVVIATSINEPGRKFAFSGQFAVDDFAAQSSACRLLANDLPATIVDDWLLDPVRAPSFQVAVFGAGHVGTATIDLLGRQDCDVRWIDGRRRIFPVRLPANVTAIESMQPAREVAAMPPGSFFLVMTHSHPLDLDICAATLQRADAAYCGVIGSRSKRRRFERQLKGQGIPDAVVQTMICPIGVAGITGKKPAEIAIAVVAELLQARDQAAARNETLPFLEVSN